MPYSEIYIGCKAYIEMALIVIVTAVIQIGALPISMFYFNYLSMATFLVNVPSIFLVGIILPMAIPVFIFSLIGDFVPDFMEVFFCDILNMLCKIASPT